MIFLQRIRNLVPAATLILLLAISLFALKRSTTKLDELRPELIAAQQQRQMAQQQAIARARQNQPATIIRPAIPPPPDSDEERRADRKTQIAIDREMLYWTKIVAGTGIASVIITGLILAFQTAYTRRAANAASDNAKSLMMSERAIVKAFPTPPGIDWTDESRYSISIKVNNFGNTPARITSVFIKQDVRLVDERLPAVPDYSEPLNTIDQGRGTEAFVVKDDFIFVPYWGQCAEPRSVRQTQTHRLYLIGYVDYLDTFGKRHRGGFARMYLPERDVRDNWPSDEAFGTRSNLGFVPQPNYNYDRERSKGEGSDWD